MSNIYEHPMLAVHAGVAAAKSNGRMDDVINAIHSCWDMDIVSPALRKAMDECKSLVIDRRSINGFYRLLCKINPLYVNQTIYTMADFHELEERLEKLVSEPKSEHRQETYSDTSATKDSILSALTEFAASKEYSDANFQLFERERYHRFWPASEIADVLEATFASEDDPGRIIGRYLRALFDGPYPDDPKLGVFFRENAPKNSRNLQSLAKRLALLIRDSELLDSIEMEALDVLIEGEAFGGVSDFDKAKGRLHAIRLAAAAAGVTNQFLFTVLALEAHTSSYLEIDDLRKSENNAVARCLLLAFLFGTHGRSHGGRFDKVLINADDKQRRELDELDSDFRSDLLQGWETVLERAHSRAERLPKSFVRFPPQFLFRFVSWGNAAIAEVCKDDFWVMDELLPLHLSSASDYSEKTLQGRAYFRWEDAEDPAPILEHAFSAVDTRSWSMATLIAFVQSNMFYECYEGTFVKEERGLGDFERELAQRCLRTGFTQLGAAFTALFLVAHTHCHGYLPETLKWMPIIEESMDKGSRKSIVRALTYAVEIARTRGNEVNALRLEGLLPDEEPVRPGSAGVTWARLSALEPEGTIQNMKAFLGGVDPRKVLDEQSLHQWVDAHRIEALIRTRFGAGGLISYIGPGHGYHAAMESTLRERLGQVYFHPDYKAFKIEVGEIHHYKKQPSLDHLIGLLKDAHRSKTVHGLLDRITSLHLDSQVISRLERLNQKYRTRTGHGKAFSLQHMGELLELLFGRESLFKAVVLNLLPKQKA